MDIRITTQMELFKEALETKAQTKLKYTTNAFKLQFNLNFKLESYLLLLPYMVYGV